MHSRDILDSYSEKSKNAADILNCMTAMQYAEEKTASNQRMREINGIVLRDSGYKSIGRFRQTQIFSKPFVTSRIQEYNPTAPDDLKPALDDLEKFLDSLLSMGTKKGTNDIENGYQLSCKLYSMPCTQNKISHTPGA